jgi:hypothetical protein
MSDINYSISANVSKGPLSQILAASGVTADMSATGLYSVSLSLGTAVTTVSTASLASVGFCFAKSLSVSTAITNTVSFGRYSGSVLYESVTLRPGEAAVMRLAAGSYAAKASAEGIPLLVQILEG